MTTPMFRKRHYEAIARVLHNERNGLCVDMIDHLAKEFEALFALDNPNFNPYKFQDAVKQGSK